MYNSHLHNILSMFFHFQTAILVSAYALNVLQMCLVGTLTFYALLTIISLHLSDFIMMFNRNMLRLCSTNMSRLCPMEGKTFS